MGGDHGDNLADLMNIVTYALLTLIIIVCVIGAVLVARRVSGRARGLGVTGFAVIALATLLNMIRDVMTQLSTAELNYALVDVVDSMVALIRTAGIVILGLALLAAAKDIKALKERLGRAGYASIPPQPAPGTQFQPTGNYGPQPGATQYGPQHNGSAPPYAGPSR